MNPLMLDVLQVLLGVILAGIGGLMFGLSIERRQKPWQRLLNHRYRHVKRGSSYVQVGTGTAQCAEPVQDMDSMVAYRDERTGEWWFRPAKEFHDRRRFEYLGEAR